MRDGILSHSQQNSCYVLSLGVCKSYLDCVGHFCCTSDTDVITFGPHFTLKSGSLFCFLHFQVSDTVCFQVALKTCFVWTVTAPVWPDSIVHHFDVIDYCVLDF